MARAEILDFVSEALESKYRGHSAADFAGLAEAARQQVRGESDPQLLEKFLGPVDGLASDIRNHVVTLQLIERVWRRRLPAQPIATMHAAIYGHPSKPAALRRQIEVADFGGAPPTLPTDIAGALQELELQVVRLLPMLRGADKGTQAMFLAHIFSSVIRIHPFEDGNGRAARLVVQLALRYWRRPMMPLPKVRNDPLWRRALDEAVKGDLTLLASSFKRRMAG